MLPIEMICNVTGFLTWDVTINGSKHEFTPNALATGLLVGHGINADDNILINVPVNNSRYVCISNEGQVATLSDPAFLYIAGKYNLHTCIISCLNLYYTHTYIVCLLSHIVVCQQPRKTHGTQVCYLQEPLNCQFSTPCIFIYNYWADLYQIHIRICCTPYTTLHTI